MDLENNATKKAYVQLLADILEKKLVVLNRLMGITEKQELLISSDTFEEEQFLQTISLKDEQIQILSKLDTGFDQLYEGVKEELNGNKEKYVMEISLLKEHISHITDVSVKLQVLETRNKSKLEIIFAQKRRDIKNARISSQTATNYYKNISSNKETQSFFYDKKN